MSESRRGGRGSGPSSRRRRGPTAGRRQAVDRRSTVEGTALDALDAIDEDGAFARDALASALGDAPGLADDERAAVAETVHTVLRHRRAIDHALDETAPDSRGARLPAEGPDRRRARLLAASVLTGRIALREAASAMPEIVWKNVLDAVRALLDATPTDEPDPTERPAAIARLAIRRSISELLAERLVADLGLIEADALLGALAEPAPVMARANRVRTTRDELVTRLAGDGVDTRPSALADDGVALVGAVSPFRLAAFHEGLFELQDEASQLVSEVVAPPPRGTVIDACAGAGGKTLHLGALLAGRGRVLAVDRPTPGGRRLAELRKRVRRSGLQNVEALEADPAAEAEPEALERLRGKAERVLVDAPCSGIGSIRRKPETRERLDGERLDRLPELQGAILDRFAPFVAPGGRLIYATCTVLRAENEGVVDAFLERHEAFERMPLKTFLGKERALAIGDGTDLRLGPHTHGTDGFYAAVLRRRPAAPAPTEAPATDESP